MRRSSSSKPGVLPAALLAAAALGLFFAPPRIGELVRTAVLDASAPGQRAADQCTAWTHELIPYLRSRLVDAGNSQPSTGELRRELDAWKQRYRTLEATHADLQNQLASLRKHGVVPYRSTSGEPLLTPDLIEARVVGEETAAEWRAGKFVNKGLADGLAADALVLDEQRPLIDLGGSQGLAADQPVFAGRTVVGKIARVGRWISTIRLVTDARFRGFARVYRKTSNGLIAGPEGLLVGAGEPLCRLTLVGETEVVNVGDKVYTAEQGNFAPVPMYYGEVVKAELQPGALEWEIHVKPAIETADMQSVVVMRERLNPARILAE